MACNFGFQHYEDILQIGLEHGYQFLDFDALSSLPPGQKGCIVRHDVDYMPEWSIRFGRIEQQLGIKSTYFFQICAKPYNLRETENYRVVRKLVDMGHTVGLHFDPAWKEGMEWEQVALLCEKDKALFEAITDIKPCDIISFHNPHRFTDLILNKDIARVRHTYESEFFSKIKYISDSQGWYEGCLCKIFVSEKYDRIQFLTHPHIWPGQTTGDFIRDMASMVKLYTDELVQYLVTFHPVCGRYEEPLRQEVRRIIFQGARKKGLPRC